jgi:hypothetical protein
MAAPTNEEDEILNSIRRLQNIERGIITRLEAGVTPDLTAQLNDVSTTRLNLYKTLDKLNTFYTTQSANVKSTARTQLAAIRIIEDELKAAKERIRLAEAERGRQIRLVEVQDYYGKAYAAKSRIAQTVFWTLVPIFVLVLLFQMLPYGWLPSSVFYGLVIIVGLIGGVTAVTQLVDMYYRSNMDFSQYAWSFDPAKGPKADTTAAASNPWATAATTADGTCIGEACCQTGEHWNEAINKCIISEGFRQKVGGIGSADDLERQNEEFIDKVLTRYVSINVPSPLVT